MPAPKFEVGAGVFFEGVAARVATVDGEPAEPRYYLDWGEVPLRLWAPESMLSAGAPAGGPQPAYTQRMPHLLVVDRFYRDPEAMRRLALAQAFVPDVRRYKGLRTVERFLFPNVREEFQRLLGVEVKDWLSQPANGVFQVTQHGDPLVWHSDLQSYAAAIYLTPAAPPASGTSFWRDKRYACRRPPPHDLERDRFAPEEIQRVHDEIYNDAAYVDPSRWELVDQVGAVFNRLVIWDAQLIHSATSYDAFVPKTNDGPATLEGGRLVQLFFFNVGRS